MNKEKTKLQVPEGTSQFCSGTDYAQTVDDLIAMLEPHRGKKVGLDNWDAELWIIDTENEDNEARIHLSVLN